MRRMRLPLCKLRGMTRTLPLWMSHSSRSHQHWLPGSIYVSPLPHTADHLRLGRVCNLRLVRVCHVYYNCRAQFQPDRLCIVITTPIHADLCL